MEGNNAERDKNLKSLAESIRKVIIICLEGLITDSEVEYEKGGIFKVHVTELDSDGILGLAVLAKQRFTKITIKRSGKGIIVKVQMGG